MDRGEEKVNASIDESKGPLSNNARKEQGTEQNKRAYLKRDVMPTNGDKK